MKIFNLIPTIFFSMATFAMENKENLPTPPQKINAISKEDKENIDKRIELDKIPEEPKRESADPNYKPSITTANNPSDQSKKYVTVNFNGAPLSQFIDFIRDTFNVTFLIEEAAASDPRSPGARPDQNALKRLSDVKIYYNGYSAIQKEKLWNLLDLFLENAGYAKISQKNIGKNIYRILPIPNSNKAHLPLYVGNEPDTLPASGRIRYIYFVKESAIDQILSLLKNLTGSAQPTGGFGAPAQTQSNIVLESYNDLKAIIVTGGAYNIKSLFEIVKEIDTASKPEVLSVLKLQNADASNVVEVYNSLLKTDDSLMIRSFDTKKSASNYFPKNTKVIAEPRTNSLIILGSKDSVRRIEDFVVNHLDTKLKKLPSPIHIYQLDYAPADQVATILNEVTQFGQGSTAQQYGGVRGGQKYFTNMFIEPDMQGNRLLIRCSDEDFELLKPTLKELDQIQQQVVIEVLIINLTLNQIKGINSALRNRFNSDVNFQTSGFAGQGPQVNSNAPAYTGSLITNLINLATSAVAGTTLVTFGKESVWAIMGIINQITKANIISNPFLVATNKYKSSVGLGTRRRVTSGSVISGSGQNQLEFGDQDAAIQLTVTPQINKNGIINLSIQVKVEEFTSSNNPNDPSSANKSTKTITTNADVADGEVLALGGLIQNRENNDNSGVPVLERIPLIGYFFKNKNQTRTDDNLLIFMAPKIIQPKQASVNDYTKEKSVSVRDFLCEMEAQESQKDPIYQWWFKQSFDKSNDIVDEMISPEKTTAPADSSGSIKDVVCQSRRC